MPKPESCQNVIRDSGFCSPEVEKQQQPSVKQRHYDTEQIRKYMQQKKAERLKHQKEKEQRVKEEEESRRRQLNELRNKQRQASAQSAAVGRKAGRQHLEAPGQETGTSWANKYPHMVQTTVVTCYNFYDLVRRTSTNIHCQSN